MNKKLLKEINHFRKLTNLPLIVEEGGRGETTVFKELLNTIFKSEAKYAAEGMFTYLNKEGRKIVLKPEVAKNILERDVTTITRIEEIEAYQALHDNIVNKFGAKTVASVIHFELKKIANPVTRETTKRFILEKSFNKSKALMTSEMENLERTVQNQVQDVKPKQLVIDPSELGGITNKIIGNNLSRDVIKGEIKEYVETRIKNGTIEKLDEKTIELVSNDLAVKIERNLAGKQVKFEQYWNSLTEGERLKMVESIKKELPNFPVGKGLSKWKAVIPYLTNIRNAKDLWKLYVNGIILGAIVNLIDIPNGGSWSDVFPGSLGWPVQLFRFLTGNGKQKSSGENVLSNPLKSVGIDLGGGKSDGGNKNNGGNYKPIDKGEFDN
jgi:hypothetical protein